MQEDPQQGMSRSQRNKQHATQKAAANPQQAAAATVERNHTSGHARLIVFLVMVSMIILSSAPVYGVITNGTPNTSQSSDDQSNSKSEKSSSSKSSSSTKKSESKKTESKKSESKKSEKSSSKVSEKSSSSAMSGMEDGQGGNNKNNDNSSTGSDNSNKTNNDSTNGNTAVLASGQTLYNFAVSHGSTTQQIMALNPGLTAENYSNYAGTALRIK
ncbi:LysM peptidoglycan-binding domain-containing protein [Eupransor demetentiae]|uniref:LysM repeat (LysM) n=1 Tax=Eupransor demetentiae TaxID=3109584 RepID=A0ABP0EQK3_9LACO|nr:LysM repeat (LysM) [Lactobacillaceae bacterium LMG 33000]